MDVQSLITEVTGRAEKFAAQGQEVATIGFDTLKTANSIEVRKKESRTEKKRDDGAACFQPSIIDLGIVEAQVPSLVAQRRSDAPKLGPAAFAARRRLSA